MVLKYNLGSFYNFNMKILIEEQFRDLINLYLKQYHLFSEEYYSVSEYDEVAATRETTQKGRL